MSDLLLVTGAGGFIGSHLVARLLAEGRHVRCLQHERDCAPGGDASGMLEVYRADLRNAVFPEQAMKGVSTVFHLAGIASAAEAHAAPSAAFQVNTAGTQNLLEAARVSGVRQIVLLSTAHVYGRPQHLPVTEDHPVAPGSIYAATKYAAEILALGYGRSYGLAVSVLRSFNVYGPGQSADAVIPSIIRQAIAGEPVRVRDLRPRRDFVFAADVVDALIRSAETPAAAGTPLILASGRPVSVAWLLRKIVALVDPGAALDTPEEPAETDDCVFGSAARARAVLGWEPQTDLDTGLARTVSWWRTQNPQKAGESRS